jgi:hypothetical protein
MCCSERKVLPAMGDAMFEHVESDCDGLEAWLDAPRELVER